MNKTKPIKKNEKSDKNPNRFPDSTVTQQRQLPDEGDDKREPMEKGGGDKDK